MSSFNTTDTIPTKYELFCSIIWITIIIPIKGMLNPLWFLDSSFIDKFDNKKMIISKTIGNKLISRNRKRKLN
jgi:hypothetical protein